MYDPQRVVEIIKQIKKDQGKFNHDIADDLGVSAPFISQVLNYKKNLSSDNLRLLCIKYNIDPISLLATQNKDSSAPIGRAISSIRRIRGLGKNDVSKQTGISILDLDHIERGKIIPTHAQLDKLSKVLNIRIELLEHGRIVQGFQNVKKELEAMGYCQEAIDSIIQYMEREL